MTQIEYEGKVYEFSWQNMGIFAVGAVLTALAVWYGTLFAWEYTHLLVVSNTVDLINWLTEIGWTELTVDFIKYNDRFVFDIPTRGNIGFENACTGVQAIAIFAGLILFTPHSKDEKANEGIWKRKILSLVVSSIIFYVVNVLRMVLQLNLYYEGHNWNSIHVSISAASSFIAAVIILLMHKWIPEFILSFVWMVAEAQKVIKGKDTIKEQEIYEEEIMKTDSKDKHKGYKKIGTQKP
mgnify:CR=1 FL=1